MYEPHASRAPAPRRRAIRAASVCLILGLVACGGARRSPEAQPPSPAANEALEAPRSRPLPASFSAQIPPEIAPNRPRAATRLLKYPWVSAAERGDATITAVDDLVVEERSGEIRYDFENAVDVVTDDVGRIYVHDSGRYRVIAYEPDGSFGRQFGSLDDAPFHLGWIAWTGGRLAMSTGIKVTVFTPDGEHAFDRSLLPIAFGRDVRGTDDGGLVGSFRARDASYEIWYSVEKRSLDGDSALTYWAVRPPARGSTSPQARPGFAATRAGEMYMTRGDEYAVQAFAADGAARWILHVELPVGAGVADELGPPALSVPTTGAAPGLGGPLQVDGRGNLYVFPYVARPDERGRVPVDVYAPDGERLFAGWIEQRSWIEQRGDFIYGIEGERGAQRIVRYRLRVPLAAAPPAARRP